MNTTIYFDMDGTIADLYGVSGWLESLINEEVLPYEIAKPLVRLNTLAMVLNRLQARGYKIGIISWTSKSGSNAYNKRVAESKQKWLAKHLASVKFDEINIVDYGTPKSIFAKSENDILFDDEQPNRNNWTGKAYDVNEIIKILKTLK